MALKQLEATLTDDALPADALAANRSALKTLQEFARSLSHPPTGYAYPPAAIKNVVFAFRWAAAAAAGRGRGLWDGVLG